MDWGALFIAIPELAVKGNLLDVLAKAGFISQREADRLNDYRKQYLRIKRVQGAIEGRAIVDRLVSVAPELLTSEAVNFLRLLGVIDKTTAQEMRIAVRMLQALGMPSRIKSYSDLIKAVARVGDAALGFDSIDLGVSLGLLKVSEANTLRGILTAGNVVIDALAASKKGDTVVRAILLGTPKLFTNSTIRALQLTGFISADGAATLKAVLRLGKTAWKNVSNARNGTSSQARMLMASQGILNQEAINVLLRFGIVNKEQAEFLRPLTVAARAATRRRLDALSPVRRIVRVVVGEAPIKTFARATRETDKDILRLLAEAASDARRSSLLLQKQGGFGNKTRAAQYNLVRNSLYKQMHALYEGVGSLTIFGEREAAHAAVDSMNMLQRVLFRRNSAELTRQLAAQAQAGIDSYISREEHTLELSKRVYRNGVRGAERAAREVQKGLLAGESATEIANRVANLIRPGTPGGVSYAAMRLARTEINNAFHQTSIRYTREMPWVTGYQWHLSSSHPKADVCNSMASEDHSGLGKGVYKKTEVPGKPHPHCFCYITTVTVSEREYDAGYRTGRWNRYIRTLPKDAA